MQRPLEPHILNILDTPVADLPGGIVLGTSRKGVPIFGHRFGLGPTRISLLAGCHADEPTGPRLLRKFICFLSRLDPKAPLIRNFDWWIVPHINPDGEAANQVWYSDTDVSYDLHRYLRYSVRELPGDDIEFGFPHSSKDQSARPENRAVTDWWTTAKGPFNLHVSLHGMAFAGGPWFLIEPDWIDRTAEMRKNIAALVRSRGFELHDSERRGEKGFHRIEPGFCTRPDSKAMRRFFLDRKDRETADRFRPSSMETVRSLGGDPLTLVTELPLFITPGVGKTPGPPDPEAILWKDRIDRWRLLASSGQGDTIAVESRACGFTPMPIREQQFFQLHCIAAGIQAATAS